MTVVMLIFSSIYFNDLLQKIPYKCTQREGCFYTDIWTRLAAGHEELQRPSELKWEVLPTVDDIIPYARMPH